MSVDAARLRAEGVPVPTDDGDALIRFDLLALSLLEEEFGSVADAFAAFNATRGPGRFEAPMFRVLGSFLRAGLASDRGVLARAEALGLVRCSGDEASDLILEAVGQAFPPLDAEGNGTADEGSTGEPSTTPPPSDGTEPTPSSGG